MREISQFDVLQKIDFHESMKGINEKDLLHFQLSLSLILATTNDIDEGIQRCLDIAMQTAAMQSGIILLFDRAKNEVAHCAHRGLDDLMKSVIPYGAISETTDALHHFNECRCSYNICLAMSKRFRSFFKLPIFNSGDLLGCMSLASNTTESIPSTVRVHLKTITALMGNSIARVIEHQELLKSRALMDSLLESASGFAAYRLAADPAGYKFQQIHISPSMQQILGREPEQWTVEDFYENIHPEDREKVMKIHDPAFITSKFETVARVYNPIAKKYVWIQVIGNAVKNKEGDITHVNGILVDVNEKQEALLAVQEKEKSLALENEKLKQLDTTLNTLLEKRERDRSELERRVVFNIKEMVLPYIRQIRNAGSAAKRNRLLDLVEMSLSDISSRFTHSLSTAQLGLTPAEMKVAAFIKQGKSTKEIAELIGSSGKTIKNQRLAIRKKIGINNKKVNLKTYLQSLQV